MNRLLRLSGRRTLRMCNCVANVSSSLATEKTGLISERSNCRRPNHCILQVTTAYCSTANFRICVPAQPGRLPKSLRRRQSLSDVRNRTQVGEYAAVKLPIVVSSCCCSGFRPTPRAPLDNTDGLHADAVRSHAVYFRDASHPMSPPTTRPSVNVATTVSTG